MDNCISRYLSTLLIAPENLKAESPFKGYLKRVLTKNNMGLETQKDLDSPKLYWKM